MRAREFITERQQLPAETADPMRWTYLIPGLSAADPYRNYRFGVALARARSDYAATLNAQNKDVDRFKPDWAAETAFGEHGVITGMNSGIGAVIDAALSMTKTPGGKTMVSSPNSIEPKLVNTHSPIKAFKGYK